MGLLMTVVICCWHGQPRSTTSAGSEVYWSRSRWGMEGSLKLIPNEAMRDSYLQNLAACDAQRRSKSRFAACEAEQCLRTKYMLLGFVDFGAFCRRYSLVSPSVPFVNFTHFQTFRANKSTKLIYRNRNPKNGPFLESIDLVFGRVYVSWGDGSILKYLVKLAHRSWNVWVASSLQLAASSSGGSYHCTESCPQKRRAKVAPHRIISVSVLDKLVPSETLHGLTKGQKKERTAMVEAGHKSLPDHLPQFLSILLPGFSKTSIAFRRTKPNRWKPCFSKPKVWCEQAVPHEDPGAGRPLVCRAVSLGRNNTGLFYEKYNINPRRMNPDCSKKGGIPPKSKFAST